MSLQGQRGCPVSVAAKSAQNPAWVPEERAATTLPPGSRDLAASTGLAAGQGPGDRSSGPRVKPRGQCRWAGWVGVCSLDALCDQRPLPTGAEQPY